MKKLKPISPKTMEIARIIRTAMKYGGIVNGKALHDKLRDAGEPIDKSKVSKFVSGSVVPNSDDLMKLQLANVLSKYDVDKIYGITNRNVDKLRTNRRREKEMRMRDIQERRKRKKVERYGDN